MSSPAEAFRCLLWALGLGAGLGVLYDFLRPPRKWGSALPDLVFTLGLLYGWLYLSFAVCRGDIRMGYTLGLLAGILLWEFSLSRLLCPVFAWIWKFLALLFLPVQKFFKFSGKIAKFLFAMGRKWGTILWYDHDHMKNPGGTPMTNRKHPFSRIRLVYRRSSPLLKCVVLAAIVLATAALLTLHFSIRQTRAQTAALRGEAARLEQENRELSQNIAVVGTMQSIKRIATEELDLVDPDAEFFYPVDP